MGRVNIMGYVLGLGAVGQALMLGNAIHHKVPEWLIFAPLLVPFVTVHIISFCRVAPCGPQRFAQILTFAMAWYVADTVVCELVWLLLPASRSRVYSAVIPHVLAYGCAVSFIALMRAVRDARQYAAEHPESI
jgi:hypothetical protein